MNRLKELRDFHALTREQCAKIAYISAKTYERYEKGERVMPLDTAIYYAKFYKVSLDYLSGLTDEPVPPNGRKPEPTDDDTDNIDPQLLFAIKRIPERQQKLLAGFLNSIVK